MNKIALLLFFGINLFASLENLNTFEADFTQNITDDKNKTISYSGHLIALKPNNALWSYVKPIKKEVYMNTYEVTIVEDEIEQVIVKKVESNFDFFKMIKNAKKLRDNIYTTKFQDTTFTIIQNNNIIESISYLDEFENKIIIYFKNQKQNQSIQKDLFIPKFPLEYDIIRD